MTLQCPISFMNHQHSERGVVNAKGTRTVDGPVDLSKIASVVAKLQVAYQQTFCEGDMWIVKMSLTERQVLELV